MDEFVRVASVDEFSEGRGRTVVLDGETIAVFRKKGKYFAFTDRCPHMGASLAMGFLTANGQVQCSWHGWKFALDTGACGFRPWAKIRLYEVRVKGTDLMLRRPAAPVAPAEAPGEEPWMTWEPEGAGGKREGG